MHAYMYCKAHFRKGSPSTLDFCICVQKTESNSRIVNLPFVFFIKDNNTSVFSCLPSIIRHSFQSPTFLNLILRSTSIDSTKIFFTLSLFYHALSPLFFSHPQQTPTHKKVVRVHSSYPQLSHFLDPNIPSFPLVSHSPPFILHS